MKKIFIFFNFSETSRGGGGNQFLNYLKEEINKDGLFTENISEASYVLINLNPLNFRFIRIPKLLRIVFSKKKIILRVDGKLQLYREKGFLFDLACEKFLFPLADGIIFQSKWAFELFDELSKPHKIILNQANLNIYQRFNYKKPENGKLKILFSSWSKSILKGYDYIDYLINELDEEKYSFTIIGQKKLPYNEKNVTLLAPMSQKELNNEFEKHNVFIFPSRNETCSNALLEAKAKGIPILAIRDAGNVEIIRNSLNLFDNKKELMFKISRMLENYEYYNKYIIDEKNIINQYTSFILNTNKSKVSILRKLKSILGLLLLKPLFRLKNQRVIYKYLKMTIK